MFSVLHNAVTTHFVTVSQPFMTLDRGQASKLSSRELTTLESFPLLQPQRLGDENPICTLEDYSKPSHEGYRNTIELPVGNNVVPLRSDTIRLVQNRCLFHGIRSEDPNQHLKDFLKVVDSLDLDGENRERTRLRLFQFSLSGQASNWLKRLPARSITTWEDLTTHFLAQFFPPGRTAKICNDILMFQQHHGESLSKAYTHFKDNSLIMALTFGSNGPHDTLYCMEDPEQAFVEYASSRTDEAGVPQSFDTEVICTKRGDGEVMFIEIIWKNDDSCENGPKEEGNTTTKGVGVEYFYIFPTRNELAYHKYLMYGRIPLIFLRNPIITEGCPSNLKIPCNIRHVHVEKAYIDPNSPLNLMTRMMYNWIMRRKLDPRENSNRGISNFIGRIKGMHVFVGNFTYIVDFMIVEDISSFIDLRLSQVVLGKPFVEISNMTHESPEGVVRFTNGTKEVAYKMPHMIEQYNSVSDSEKEHAKSVYLRNEEDKGRGVEYVMSKILGFYNECLEHGPE
ncbi:MAK10-like protein [Tanacetum coccineum]